MGILDSMLPDVEKRVNQRMEELNKSLDKVTKDFGESCKPLIVALNQNTEAVEALTRELKRAKKKSAKEEE